MKTYPLIFEQVEENKDEKEQNVKKMSKRCNRFLWFVLVLIMVLLGLFGIILGVIYFWMYREMWKMYHKICSYRQRPLFEERTQKEDLQRSIVIFCQTHVPYYQKYQGKPFQEVDMIDKQSLRNEGKWMMDRHGVEKRMEWTERTSQNVWTDKRDEETISTISLWEALSMVIGILQGKALAQVTGGTSGQYFYQWYAWNELWWGIYSFFRGWVNLGWTPKKRVMIFYSHGSNSIKLLHYFPGWIVVTPVFTAQGKDLTPASVQDFLHHLETKKPFLVVTFPNVLFRICQHIYASGYTLSHNPTAFDISADFLFTCQYRFIQSIFPYSDIRMSYGTMEFGQIAQQIPHELYTYEVYSELAYVESDQNRLVVTHYRYHTLPIVRYRTDDVGHVRHVRKESQRQFIDRLVGKQPKGMDYYRLDAQINEMNSENNIIHLRMNAQQTFYQLIVKTKQGLTPSFWKSIRNITGDQAQIEIMTCDQTACPSIDHYQRKNTPILNEYHYTTNYTTTHRI